MHALPMPQVHGRCADSGADGDYITPSSSNIIRDTNPKIETFAQRDSNGFAMTIMAMCVVFFCPCSPMHLLHGNQRTQSACRQEKS